MMASRSATTRQLSRCPLSGIGGTGGHTNLDFFDTLPLDDLMKNAVIMASFVYHAAMMDPHTAAELDIEQIYALVDDLIQAHGDWLPQFE